MNEIGFRKWLEDNGMKKKVAGDTVYRLRRIEKEFDQCDLDEQYRIDRCETLKLAFSNLGNNEVMKKYQDTSFPIGKYYLSTFRYALNEYVKYCDSISSN